ncbi:MAG: CARDB domain-containing protein [Phycisphaerales bacterium]
MEPLEQRALLAVDLAYTTLSVANNALPGGTVTVNSTLTNNGNEDVSTPFTVKFFLSADSTLDGGDLELGTFESNVTIPATGTLGFAKQLSIPGDTPLGDRFIIGVADSGDAVAESDETNNTGSGQFFVGNTPPSVDSPIIGPFTGMTRTSTLTILILNAVDDDNISGSLEVTFWYDFDGDNVLSDAADRLIGAGEAGPNNSYVFSGPVPTFVRPGLGRIFVKAFDGLDSTVRSGTFTLNALNEPVVQTLSALPGGSPEWGQTITFTAGGVSNPDDAGSVQAVRLYRDSNGAAGLQTDSDELIGLMMRDGMTDRWTLETTVLDLWGTLSRFFAQATDSMGRVSVVSVTPREIATALLSFTDVSPVTIGSLTGPVGAARRGREITLTAGEVSDNGQTVRFYRDSDGNGLLDAETDQLLGEVEVEDGSAALAFTIAPEWGAGAQKFFVQGFDSAERAGDAEVFDLALAANKAPRLRSLTVNETTRSKGQTLILTANNVTDDDGASGIASVDFFRDSNRNGRLDPATDVLLGQGTRITGTNNYRLSLVVPNSFRNGLNKIFVRATDIVGVNSAARAVDVTATKNTRPTLASLTVTPGSAGIGRQITFLARGVSDNGGIGSVRFYRDSDGNGIFDINTDALIGTGGRVAQGTFRRRFVLNDGFSTGTQKFFAVVFDNLGLRSVVRSQSITINA